MANHAFVTTKKWLKADRVEEDLKEILARRFNNKIPYKRDGDTFEIGFRYPWNFPMWVENVHKLEFRHQPPDWCWWVEIVIANELALKYNGIISDEGVDEKWAGVANKYPKYDDWLDAKHTSMPRVFKWFFKNMQKYVEVPKEVKDTYK